MAIIAWLRCLPVETFKITDHQLSTSVSFSSQLVRVPKWDKKYFLKLIPSSHVIASLCSNANLWPRRSEKQFEVVRNVATASIEATRGPRTSGRLVRTNQHVGHAEPFQTFLAVHAFIVAASAWTGPSWTPNSCPSGCSTYVTAHLPRNNDAPDEPGTDRDADLSWDVSRLWLSHFRLHPVPKATLAFTGPYGQSSAKTVYTFAGIRFRICDLEWY